MGTECTMDAPCGKTHLVFRCDACSRLAYQLQGCNGWCTGDDGGDGGPDTIRIRGEDCRTAKQLRKERVKFSWPEVD